MNVEEVSQAQLDILIKCALDFPKFSTAEIPEDHPHHPIKGDYYNKVGQDVRHLESLGLVSDITHEEEKSTNTIKLAEAVSGYRYKVYEITDLGTLLFLAYAKDYKKETEYKNSIN
jgi:hypothetical protein